MPSAGGFLGLDNLGPFDRSALPVSGRLEQSDGTAWMAMYCQNLLELALLLAEHDQTYEDMATKFFEHFALIASALNDKGLWNDEDGFYYDVLHLGDGAVVPLKARSIVGLLPLAAVTTLGPATMARLPDFMARVEWFTANRREGKEVVQHTESPEHAGWRMLSIVDEARLRRILAATLDPSEFLSDDGLRALSKFHEEHPLQVWSTACRPRSTTIRASRRAASSAATRTGAGQSGCRSTTCWSRRSGSTTATSETRSRSIARPARAAS